MPVPGSPLPLLSVPLSREDGQVTTAPVVVSFRVNVPDFRETGPPGRTVQVAAARAVLPPTVAARTAAQPATRMRAERRLTAVVLHSWWAAPGPQGQCQPPHGAPAGQGP